MNNLKASLAFFSIQELSVLHKILDSKEGSLDTLVGSTVTLNNAVPIHVVKELLGHQSVKQTEEYAITEQQSVGREMKQLQLRLNQKTEFSDDPAANVLKMQQEIISLRKQLGMESDTKPEIKSVLRICK